MMFSESGALVRFYSEAVQDTVASDEAGRPIFKDQDFVQIQTPGDTKTLIERIARKQDIERFPRAWQAYKTGKEAVLEGTPIEEWALITKSQAMELKGVGIMTVEILAETSDTHIQKLGPGYMKLKVRAGEYLDSADVDAKATAWAREKELLEERIALLEQENTILREAQQPVAKVESEKKTKDKGKK